MIDHENYIYVIEILNENNRWMALDFEHIKMYANMQLKNLKNLNPKNKYRIRLYMPLREDENDR